MKSTAAKAAILLALALALSSMVLSSGRAFAFPAVPGASSSDSTSLTLSSNPLSSSPGSSVTLTAVVTDTGATPSVPTGQVSFSDGGSGGSFSQQTCILSATSGAQASCAVTYTIAASATSKVTLIASYSGDTSHLSSSGAVTVTLAYPVTISISPASSSIVSGKSVNFTATVSVPGSTTAPAPTGDITWSDSGAGGTFSATDCQLPASSTQQSSCSVVYKSYGSVTVTAVQVTITATYSGDISHAAGSSSTGLVVLPPQVSVLVSYSVVGSTQGSSAPVFTYLLDNKTQAVALSGVPSIYKVDVNTLWFVPNQLGNSSSNVAWNLLGDAQGSASYSLINSQGVIPLRFIYYHQVLVTLGCNINGGTAGASVPCYVTYTSFGVTKQTGAPGTTWVDFGTQYFYPAMLPGSLGTERWVGLGPNGSASAVNGTLTAPGDYSVTYYHQYLTQVTYGVVNPPSVPLPAPTFFGVSLGVPFNASVASMTSRVWLDAGSQYSFTNPLNGSTSTVRWDAGSAGAGPVTGPTIAVKFYKQYQVSAWAAIVGSVPVADIGGHPGTPVSPVLAGMSGGIETNVSLAAQPSMVWLDSGSSYSIAGSLLSLANERWVAAGAVNGAVSPGASVNQTYFQQFLVSVSYLGAPPSSSPLFLNYTSLGNEATSPLDAGGSTVWADAGSSLVVPDSTPGSRWANGPGQSTTVDTVNATVEFIQQYALHVSLNVVGGGLPVASYVSGTSGGAPLKAALGAQPSTVWLDGGTSYFIPQDLLQIAQERWVAAANLTGSVTGPENVTQTFYHQDLLNFSFTGDNGTQPTVSYVALGSAVNSTLGPVWADYGTPYSIENAVSAGTGQRFYADPIAGNVTGPIQASAQYFAQDLLNFTYGMVGGTLAPPPSLTGTVAGALGQVALSSESGAVWLDSGSHWRISLSVGQMNLGTERWLETGPTQGTLTSPTTVGLEYYNQFMITTVTVPPTGGNVTQGGWYNASTTAILNAVPVKGWTLGAWVGVGSASYSGSNQTISIPVLSAMNETVNFEPSLTIVSSNGGSVEYTTGPSLQTLGPGRSVQAYVQAGGNITIEARASFPYTFVGWSGTNNPAENPVSFAPSAPATIEAHFAPNYYDLVGLPALVFAGSLSTYVARRSIAGLGRSALKSIRTRLRWLRS